LTTIVQPAAIAGAGRIDHVAAVDADGLLGEPPQEVRGVGDLRTGFSQSLAHLERHQQRELLGARGERLVSAAQDLAPLPRRPRGPLGLALGGRGERGERVGRLGVGDLEQRISGGGILDGESPRAGGGTPVPVDVELRGNPLQHGPLA